MVESGVEVITVSAFENEAMDNAVKHVVRSTPSMNGGACTGQPDFVWFRGWKPL